MDDDRPTPPRPTPATPAPRGPWRLVGWDPHEPGSAVWLSTDGRGTRRSEHAYEVDSYAAAERVAIELSDRHAAGLRSWMPALASRDLSDLQETVRRPRPRAVLGVPTPPY